MSDTDHQEIDALISRYVGEAQAEFAVEAAERDAEERRLRASFEAGAKVVTLQAITLYDPVEGRRIETRPGDVLEVASDEGDIFIGRLANNSHSIGVLYEERQHWTTRKYFMPLAAFCDRARVRAGQADDLARRTEWVRHGKVDGKDARSKAAIQELEALDAQDQAAVLPRGTLIILKHGAMARGLDTGAPVNLAPGAVVEVTEAYGDTGDGHEPDRPQPIKVTFEGAALALPVEALAELDHGPDVLTPFEQAQIEAKAATRRGVLRKAFGAGVGVALGGLTLGAFHRQDGFGQWHAPPESRSERSRRKLVSSVVPQLGLIYGYLGAGGKYWFELKGLLLDLAAARCLDAARGLRAGLEPIAAMTADLWSVYESAYYRRVHTHWVETRHYKTDSDGKRTYSHSTWSKGYSMLWVEPSGLGGQHGRVRGWSNADAFRLERAQRLENERIFNLLEADKDNPESDFKLRKQKVPFTVDAAKSAFSAAAMVLPATFYDDVIRACNDGDPVFSPARERWAKQKGSLALAGAVVGMIWGEMYRQKLGEQLEQNRYDLGQTVEAQLRRVPTLSLEAVWLEFFGCDGPDAMTPMMHRRESTMAYIARTATSFTYTHGSGWDDGRRLDSIYVDSSQVTHVFGQTCQPHHAAVAALQAFLKPAEVREKLLRVLRNVVGTEILDAQVEEDQDEATGGSVRRSLRFAAPVWGAMVLDLLIKS